MTNENVLTHKAFARAPIEKRRRPGRYPKSIVRLDDVRRSRRDDEVNLRAWAREHANVSWTLDQVRIEKQWRDAEDLLERRNDDIWREVKQLQEGAAALLHKASRLQSLLVKQQLAEQIGQVERHGQ